MQVQSKAFCIGASPPVNAATQDEMLSPRHLGASEVRIPTKAATDSNLIAATVPT